MVSEMAAGERLAVRAIDKLCANLADVIHAMAQPLTILQGRLDKSRVAQMNLSELRGLAHESAKETDRLCNLFGYMQGFMVAETVEPCLSRQAVCPMLTHAAEGLQSFFKQGGISLRLDMQSDVPPVIADPRRMDQALSRMLLLVYGFSAANDTIELAAVSPFDATHIVIRNARARPVLDKEARLKLALSEANIRSQNGALTWTTDPLSVQIELPAASAEGEQGGL